MVDNEVELTWDELLALPLEESITTLACVSNEVGGDLIGNAVWLGYPIRELLARATPTGRRRHGALPQHRRLHGVAPRSRRCTDDRNAILAVGMNGEPLPAEHGFPVRMVVPGLYGYVSATKWVVELEVTRFDEATAYWTDRGWSERGPIKLAVAHRRAAQRQPAHGRRRRRRRRRLAPAHRHRGRRGAARRRRLGGRELATAISIDTWVQWSYAGDARAGRPHRCGCGRPVPTARCRPSRAKGSSPTARPDCTSARST